MNTWESIKKWSDVVVCENWFITELDIVFIFKWSESLHLEVVEMF